VHGERRSNMQEFIRALLAAAPKPRGSVRVQVDIDPQSFL
jgi:primosomal protein N' (replication factor Y) (superfamily II helicase)